MLTNDSVGSNRALKRYSRHRRQRTDCCYKRAAERRSLSRPCRPSKYLAGLTCSDPGTAPKSMAPRGDVWPTQPDRLMQELEGTEALRALRCERFLSSSPSLLPLVLTQSPAEYILLGLSAPAAAPAPSESVHGYIPINFSQPALCKSRSTSPRLGSAPKATAFRSSHTPNYAPSLKLPRRLRSPRTDRTRLRALGDSGRRHGQLGVPAGDAWQRAGGRTPKSASTA